MCRLTRLKTYPLGSVLLLCDVRSGGGYLPRRSDPTVSGPRRLGPHGHGRPRGAHRRHGRQGPGRRRGPRRGPWQRRRRGPQRHEGRDPGRARPGQPVPEVQHWRVLNRVPGPPSPRTTGVRTPRGYTPGRGDPRDPVSDPTVPRPRPHIRRHPLRRRSDRRPTKPRRRLRPSVPYPTSPRHQSEAESSFPYLPDKGSP